MLKLPLKQIALLLKYSSPYVIESYKTYDPCVSWLIIVVNSNTRPQKKTEYKITIFDLNIFLPIAYCGITTDRKISVISKRSGNLCFFYWDGQTTNQDMYLDDITYDLPFLDEFFNEDFSALYYGYVYELFNCYAIERYLRKVLAISSNSNYLDLSHTIISLLSDIRSKIKGLYQQYPTNWERK